MMSKKGEVIQIARLPRERSSELAHFVASGIPVILEGAAEWAKSFSFHDESFLEELSQSQAQEGGLWFELALECKFLEKYPFPAAALGFTQRETASMRATPMRVWVHGKGNVSPMHFDANAVGGFNLSVRGKKHWLLVGPEEQFPLFPFSSLGLTSQTNAEALAQQGYRVHEAVIGAGEMLYLPPSWLHQVEALEDTVNMNLVFTDRESFTAPDPILRREMRLLVLKKGALNLVSGMKAFSESDVVQAYRGYLQGYGAVPDFGLIRSFENRETPVKILRTVAKEFTALRRVPAIYRMWRDLQEKKMATRNEYAYFQERNVVEEKPPVGSKYFVNRSRARPIRTGKNDRP